ncbi:DUF3137 domain-containing protein [Glycomyces tenuis]|uniref:DUF3137 domain-containing protein n=1 Tax=Glycomyces tenuis TaxID=58116 RepID=UPI0012DD1553|nr:DUF3137 domain-containing protein [Glycomyces tenuis]
MPLVDPASSAALWVTSALCFASIVAVPILAVWYLQRWTTGSLIGWREQKRLIPHQQRQMPYFRQWAAERGMIYAPRNDAWAGIAAPWPFIGEDARAEHVFTGTVGCHEVAAFQYSGRLSERGRVGLIRDRRRVLITCVAVRLPAPRLELLIIPGTAFDQATQRAGFAPVGLRYENPRFNERFRVTAENERFAHDVLTPRMMEWMLADPLASQRPLMVRGAFLITWHKEPITLEPLDSLIGMLGGFLDRVPGHVWTQPLMRPRPPQALDHTCRGTCAYTSMRKSARANTSARSTRPERKLSSHGPSKRHR